MLSTSKFFFFRNNLACIEQRNNRGTAAKHRVCVICEIKKVEFTKFINIQVSMSAVSIILVLTTCTNDVALHQLIAAQGLNFCCFFNHFIQQRFTFREQNCTFKLCNCGNSVSSTLVSLKSNLTLSQFFSDSK